MDMAKIENTSRILERYQSTTFNAAVASGNPSPIQRGAPGPAPSNRSAGLTLEERARNTQAMIFRQQGGR
jgi:hypothetical protein